MRSNNYLRASIDHNQQQIKQSNIIVQYSCHMHPLTQIQTPDLLEKDRQSTFDITCQILYTALPLFLCFILNSGTCLINIFMIGHQYGTLQFTAICFGTVLANVFVYYIIQNIGLGFNFVCSYFDQKQDIGYMYQKMLGINFLVCILITPILYLSDKVLRSLEINSQLVNMAGNYVWALVPSFYLYAFFQTTTNYLQSQGVLYPPIIISLLGNIFHLIVSYIFVFGLGFSLIGVAWSKNLTDSITSLTLYCYIIFKEPTKESWIQWDIKATNNIHRFLIQVMSEQIYVLMEVGAFQIMCIIVCGMDDMNIIAAHFVFAFTYLIVYFGFSAISHCINKELSVSIQDDKISEGLDRGIKSAKKKMSLGLIITFVMSLVIVVNLEIHKHIFLQLFDQTTEVRLIINDNMYIFYAFIFLTGFQDILLGIIKTLQVKVLWKISIISFYLVGLGSSIGLGYGAQMGLQGMWLGWCLGYFVSFVFLIRFIYKMDWSQTFVLVRDKFKTIKDDIRVSKMELLDDRSESSFRH